jgi:hypothetical protein
MKKTIIAVTTVAMLSSAAAPAFADDMFKRLIIGGAAMAVGELIKSGAKGGSRSSGREPRRGDTLIGRVGDEGSSRRSSGAGKGAAATAAVAAAAITLPELGPSIEFRPSEQEMAAYRAAPTSSEAENGEAVTLTDEAGVVWGKVAPEIAAKIDQAKALGMKPSQAFAALSGLPEPKDADAQAEAIALANHEEEPPVGAEPLPGLESQQAAFAPIAVPTDTFADGSDGSELLEQGDGGEFTPAAPVKKAEATDNRNGDFATIWNRQHTKGTVFDQDKIAWGDFDAATIAKIDAATNGGMIRSEAIIANTEFAAPGRTKAQEAAAKAKREENERKVAEAAQRARDAAEAEQKRVAEEKTAREKAREIAQAEADAKAKADAEARRMAELAKMPATEAFAAQAQTPAVVEKTPAVDTTATTASVSGAAETVPAKKSEPVLEKPQAKKPAVDLDL